MDYYSFDEDTPAKDTQQDFVFLGSEVQSGRLKKIKFKRKLTTTDTTRDDVIVPDKSVEWSLGERSGNSFAEHTWYADIRFTLCSNCTGRQESTLLQDLGLVKAHRIFLLM